MRDANEGVTGSRNPRFKLADDLHASGCCLHTILVCTPSSLTADKRDTVTIPSRSDILKAMDKVAKEESGSRPELIRLAARMYIEPQERWDTISPTVGRPSPVETTARGNETASTPAHSWEEPKLVQRDPKDTFIVGCAIARSLEYIVMGDDDVVRIKTGETIPIATPTAFPKCLNLP